MEGVSIIKACSRDIILSGNVRKCTFWRVRPSKPRINLCIRAVWSESSLSARRNFASLTIQNLLSEDSDQLARMSRLIWILAGRIYPEVHFLMLRIISLLSNGFPFDRTLYRHMRLQCCTQNLKVHLIVLKAFSLLSRSWYGNENKHKVSALRSILSNLSRTWIQE